MLESLEQWEIYEFAALGAAVLLCCCCCVACICRKRLMRCCGRCSPCCPCSHDLEASRPSRASRILRDNAKGREKRERKKEKKEKKEKRPKKKGERDLKGSEVAIDPGRGCKPRLPSMCVGVLDPTPRGPGAVSAPSAPSDWEEFEDDASGQARAATPPACPHARTRPLLALPLRVPSPSALCRAPSLAEVLVQPDHGRDDVGAASRAQLRNAAGRADHPEATGAAAAAARLRGAGRGAAAGVGGARGRRLRRAVLAQPEYGRDDLGKAALT